MLSRSIDRTKRAAAFFRTPSMQDCLRRAAPIIAGHVTIALLGVVDTAVAGRMPGVVFLAAVGLGSIFAHFVFWLFGFLRMGTTGVTAQAIGAGDARGVRLSLLRGAGFGATLGLLLLLLSPLITFLAVELYVQDKSLTQPFAQYLSVRFIGAPFALASYAFYGWFLGINRSALMMMIQTSVIAANIVLSPLLAFGFGWGVEGIAWATVIAEILGAALSLVCVVRILARSPHMKLMRKIVRADIFDLREVRRFFAINTHIFFRTLCLLLAFQLFWLLSASVGTIALAVNTILRQLIEIAAFALDGFALAGEAMVGEQVARHASRTKAVKAVESAVRVVFVWSCLFALLFASVYAIAFNPIVAGFTDLEAVRSAAPAYRWFAVFVPIVAVWSYAWDGIFLGLTLTRALMIGMALAAVGFVLCALPLTALFGNVGLWIALYLFFIFRALTLYVSWRKWRKEGASGGGRVL